MLNYVGRTWGKVFHFLVFTSFLLLFLSCLVYTVWNWLYPILVVILDPTNDNPFPYTTEHYFGALFVGPLSVYILVFLWRFEVEKLSESLRDDPPLYLGYIVALGLPALTHWAWWGYIGGLVIGTTLGAMLDYKLKHA
jgi:hypothetical protein